MLRIPQPILRGYSQSERRQHHIVVAVRPFTDRGGVPTNRLVGIETDLGDEKAHLVAAIAWYQGHITLGAKPEIEQPRHVGCFVDVYPTGDAEVRQPGDDAIRQAQVVINAIQGYRITELARHQGGLIAWRGNDRVKNGSGKPASLRCIKREMHQELGTHRSVIVLEASLSPSEEIAVT